MKRAAFLVTLFLAFPALLSFAQSIEYTLSINSNGIIKELTLGYHPFATDGVDTTLGEINLPPYTPNQFDVRFRLFDTTLSTHKDLRFGCPFGASLHILEWKYGNNIVISGGELGNSNIYNITIINPNNGNHLATFEWSDSVNFNVSNEFNYVVIYASTLIPLSWPSYNINSIMQGDLIPAGSSKLLSWTLNLGFPGYTDMTLSTDNGESWSYIAQDLPHSQSSYNWTVPNINTNRCIIRVGDYPCIYDEVGTFFIYQGSFPQLFPTYIPLNLRNGNNEIVNLTAGLHPQATSGLDTALGEIPHNFSPPGIFDAAFRNGGNYSRKDIQFGHQLVYGSRIFYFSVRPSPDSIVIIEAALPQNTTAEIEYHKQLPYGSIPERKYLGSGNINYQLPRSSLFQYNWFKLGIFFDNVVPVDILSFKGIVIEDGVQLEWTTSTEKNNHGFEVQKKYSDGSYAVIGFVQGAGTKITPTTYLFIDKSNISGKYFYRLKQVDYNGNYDYSTEVEINVAPEKFELHQNYPNPFNPTTKIRYTIPALTSLLPQRERMSEGHVRVILKVYDILGREVATLVNEAKPTGNYEVEFDGSKLASGLYIYTLKAGGYVSSKKMILLK